MAGIYALSQLYKMPGTRIYCFMPHLHFDGSPPSVRKGEYGIGFEAGFVAIMEHLSAHGVRVDAKVPYA